MTKAENNIYLSAGVVNYNTQLHVVLLLHVSHVNLFCCCLHVFCLYYLELIRGRKISKAQEVLKELMTQSGFPHIVPEPIVM